MGTRVHVCSVERQLEPRLDEKLVILCDRVEYIVHNASSLNEGGRCIVDGCYLAFATLQVDGYYHINDVVLQQITDECELAFGYNNVKLLVADTSRNQIIIECSFTKRRKYPRMLSLLLPIVCLCALACFFTESSLLHQIATACSNIVNSTNHSEI
jgi:hypothetical protein